MTSGISEIVKPHDAARLPVGVLLCQGRVDGERRSALSLALRGRIEQMRDIVMAQSHIHTPGRQ